MDSAARATARGCDSIQRLPVQRASLPATMTKNLQVLDHLSPIEPSTLPSQETHPPGSLAQVKGSRSMQQWTPVNPLSNDDIDQLMDSSYHGGWSLERFHEEMGTQYQTLQDAASLTVDVEMDIETAIDEIVRPTPLATVAAAVPKRNAPKKKRKMWTDQETKDLLRGCAEHGIGNWKRILDDPKFTFDHRTSVDLKDRFRTCFPVQYTDHVSGRDSGIGQSLSPETTSAVLPSTTPTNTTTTRPVGDASTTKKRKRTKQSTAHVVDGESGKLTKATAQGQEILERIGLEATSLPRGGRRGRQAFTAEEDARLLEGFMKYGPAWAKIANDKSLGLNKRRNTDIRDRFRNRYRGEYEAAGYKAPAPKPMPPRSDPAPPPRSTEPPTPEDIHMDIPIGLHTGIILAPLSGPIPDDPPPKPVKKQRPRPARFNEALMHRLLQGAPSPWALNQNDSPGDETSDNDRGSDEDDEQNDEMDIESACSPDEGTLRSIASSMHDYTTFDEADLFLPASHNSNTQANANMLIDYDLMWQETHPIFNLDAPLPDTEVRELTTDDLLDDRAFQSDHRTSIPNEDTQHHAKRQRIDAEQAI